MTVTQAPRGGWFIATSFLVSLTLTVLPLPSWAALLRPDWPALVLVYWCLALPQRVGVGMGWLLGLLQDTLQGSLLGAHALAYAVVAFLAVRLHQRLRVFPLWQQALIVLLLLLLVRLVLWWMAGLTGRPSPGGLFLLPAAVGTLLWPAVFVTLREFRRRFQVG